MRADVFWILIAIIVTLGVMAIVISVLLMRSRQHDRGTGADGHNWHVELWNICYGYQVDLRFENTCVLGRAMLYDCMATRRIPEMDTTVSREHCMLYEQEGILLAWNMSVVNPAAINGFRINQPVQIMPGDRLELGNSAFLITRVERVQA